MRSREIGGRRRIGIELDRWQAEFESDRDLPAVLADQVLEFRAPARQGG